MKGIILAGGHGTRLHPATLSVSKQLIPVHDKPMIYYPLSVLMLADIRDILLISAPEDLDDFQNLLGDGTQLGIRITYRVQDEPRGIADAFLLGAEHVGADSVALILGDNIFHGAGFRDLLASSASDLDGCVLFCYTVSDPERYGVAETDEHGRLLALEEKPSAPRSRLAVTGLYFYDNDVLEIARSIEPSDRDELEITDVNRVYLHRGTAKVVDLGRDFAWLDTGTPDSLTDAGQYVQLLEQRHGVRIGCIEEVALQMGFIDEEACRRLGEELSKSEYGQYVMDVAGPAPGITDASGAPSPPAAGRAARSAPG
jgi:glucose-1-phosphate thymidylyltransferase